MFLTPKDLNGLPLQILALPWISRSGLMAHLGVRGTEPGQVYQELEKRITDLVREWMEQADPDLPTILTAHASVQGAVYGGERTVMLGQEMVLPGSLVKDPRFDYVALGHIHKPQDLNENGHPPVIYPGSIERVDFGEAAEDKYYVIANVERGETQVAWHQLKDIRPFIDRFLALETQDDVNEQIEAILPGPDELDDAIVRLVLEYPREWEPLIDEAALREITAGAFEFHLVKRPQQEGRIRLPEDQTASSMDPVELLRIYWQATHTEAETITDLVELAKTVISDAK